MFCDWLRNSRRGLGLTQKQLGELAGVSASAVGMYEQGRRRPGAKVLARLRGYFAERGMEMPPPMLPGQEEVPAKRRFRAEVGKLAGGKVPRGG